MPARLRTAPDALTASFHLHYADLVRFLTRRAGCREVARELAHDTWLRMAQRDPEATAPQSADHTRAYLFTVAEHLAVDHLRRRRHWRDQLAPMLQHPDARTPDVAESHAHGQALRSVVAALDAMPARMREVFVAHRLEGVPHDLLAERFGVSRKTIERDVTQAMDLAQAALSGDDPARRGRRKAIGTLLGVGAAGVAGHAAWASWRDEQPQWQASARAPAGQLRRLSLPDGSTITVDALGEVALQQFAHRRTAHLLTGNAYFDVVPDVPRPFEAWAGGARLTTTAGRFAIDLAEGGQVTVAVSAGRVALGALGFDGGLDLAPGDTARVRPGGAPERTGSTSDDRVAPWRLGWLDFDRQPLGAVAERLNHYRPHAPIHVDPRAANLPVLARVEIARSDTWLRGLAAVLPVRVYRDTAGAMRVAARG